MQNVSTEKNETIVAMKRRIKGGEPPHPCKKNSGLLTQKLLASTNGELYAAV